MDNCLCCKFGIVAKGFTLFCPMNGQNIPYPTNHICHDFKSDSEEEPIEKGIKEDKIKQLINNIKELIKEIES